MDHTLFGNGSRSFGNESRLLDGYSESIQDDRANDGDEEKDEDDDIDQDYDHDHDGDRMLVF